MSNQEAIEVIKLAQAQVEWEYPMDYAEAFDMAISAIQAQDLQSTCNQLATDFVSRQAAIDAILKQTVCATKRELVEICDANISDENGWLGGICIALDTIEDLPSAHNKGYTKADYIMALHKEYGCSLARAEEAHQKALEYLRNTSMMKG